jgi:hypothetical protein
MSNPHVDQKGHAVPNLDDLHVKLLSRAAKFTSGTIVGSLNFDSAGNIAEVLSMKELEKLGYLEKVTRRTPGPQEEELVYRITDLGRAAFSKMSQDFKGT